MSEEKRIELTVCPDKQTWETIQLVAEAKKMTIEEVVEDFLLSGAVDRSVQAIIKAEVESCANAINCQIVELSGKIDRYQLETQGHLDSLEISVDKVIERFN